MTTAARPTFDPAKGKSENELTYLTSAKDLPSHTKLKTRKPGQGGDDEYTAEELRLELEEAERRHFAAKTNGSSSTQTIDHKQQSEEKARYIEMAQRLDAESSTSSVSDNESAGSDSDSSESESEDETAMLMRELEKIKRERAEEKARDEQETLERRLLDNESHGNPLLAQHDFMVKRRWDDDVVFKNQARGDSKPKKRFVNDMLRSDFHNKFMRKYIQ
ncbi:hypothetical protein GGH96_002524 [Coemansia sp. RSA 1972]|nr:hypothetical protein GGH96_002524 [Coemansia sp. RSA 1972]